MNPNGGMGRMKIPNTSKLYPNQLGLCMGVYYQNKVCD